MASPRELMALEAQADAWYGKIVSIRRRLERETLTPAEREALELDLLKYERELATIDRAVERVRRELGEHGIW